MNRNLICFFVAILLMTRAETTYGELLGYWSADSTGGTGTVLPNDQGDDLLDGELIDIEYTASGQGHTGAVGDYALDFPGEDFPHVAIPPTEATFDDATITAWVNGEQTGDWSGVVHTRDSSQPMGIGYRAGTGQLQYHWNNNSNQTYGFVSGLVIPENEWAFIAVTVEEDQATLFLGSDGLLESAVNEIFHDPQDNVTEWRLGEDNCCSAERNYLGLLDDVSIWDEALSEEQINSLFLGTETPLSLAGLGGGKTALQAGDANQDYQFDQLDLVAVQIAAKYLTGQAATWGEGDWDGAPGGTQGTPPPGNGFFDQLDVIAALGNGLYLMGPYNALAGPEGSGDGNATIVYDATTGEVRVDVPGTQLTAVNITSAAGIFTGDPADHLTEGGFDNDTDENIFKSTFGTSFGSLSFGKVAQTGLSEDFVTGDLTVIGALQGGGGLGAVDLRHIPEPSTFVLLGLALAGALWMRWRSHG